MSRLSRTLLLLLFQHWFFVRPARGAQLIMYCLTPFTLSSKSTTPSGTKSRILLPSIIIRNCISGMSLSLETWL
ncbi:MAG: hypothetical protein J3R72DRAFT_100025 [Linnemannia gamsii]|nr:MAG: hypothetical protein J3R72DRAFT_100025 [Linnemannia gamsii]